MATESPLIHDGSQMQAAANYWNPASALFGPNGSGQFLAVTISAGRTVTLASSPTAMVYGVLQNTPAQGQAADVGLYGPSKAVAGAAISAGADLTVDANGRLVAAASGNYVVGWALEAAAGANAVFTAFLTCPTTGKH